MKKFIKATAVIAAAAALACSTGCNGDTKWSYKNSEKTLTAGNWIFQTFVFTTNAVSKIKETKEDADITTIDFSSEKIEGKKAIKWIENEAKNACIKELTLEKMAKEYKADVDEDSFEASTSYMNSFYEYYYQSICEKLGVSKESYIDASMRTDFLYDVVFKKIYGKDGEKEVSDDDLKKYFIDNYTSYYYLSYSLKTKDDSGNSTDIDDETKEKVNTNFNKYVHMLNDEGKTTNDVSETYKTDFEVDTAPATTDSKLTKDLSDDTDLNKEIKASKVKVARLVTIDDTMYLIYRFDEKEMAENIKEDAAEENAIDRTSVLKNMKSEEFDKLIEEKQKSYKYDKNDACLSRYTVQRTIDILKEQSKSS